MKKNVLVTGSIAYDYIMNFHDSFKNHILPEKIHVLSVSFVAERLEKQYGGTAGNIAYNLALLEEQPIVFSTVGKDFNEYKKWFDSNNIDTSHIKEFPEEYTASAHIITDDDDNQITAFHGGAMMKNDISIAHILDEQDIAFAIIAPNAKEGNIRYISELKERNIPYVLDPGQNMPLFGDEELKNAIDSTMMFIVNDYELSLAEKKTGYTKDYLINNLEYLIVTLGKEGSEIYHNGKLYKIAPAKPDNTSDPTGAGDAYRAGIIKGILHGLDIQTIGELASTVAVYTVEKYGTQTHTFTMDELKKRYKDNYNKELTL